MEEKEFDIERVIKSKNPKLLKWTPKFLLNYLKRKLREDEVNESLKEMRGASGIEFARYVIKKFHLNIVTSGLENIPKKGGAIFVLNHPLGGVDAMAIIAEMHKIRPDYKFVVNDILLSLENMKDVFVGVNKHGVNTKEALDELNNIFATDQVVFVFPAGLVSRRKKGKIKDLEWKKTFVTRAKKYKRPVIPVRIEGRLSNFFYRISNFRKRIGIKANIEMLYLIDEQFKQENKTIELKFGKPISYKTFDKSKKDIEWAQWVKDKVYNL